MRKKEKKFRTKMLRNFYHFVFFAFLAPLREVSFLKAATQFDT